MMKTSFLRPALACLGLVSILSTTGCEEHSPAVTVKGYAEKEALKAEARKSEDVEPQPKNPDPPRFFPEPTPQVP